MTSNGPFENELGPLAQFQLVTVFVWITELIILFSLSKHWVQSHNLRYWWMIPLWHVVPWFIGIKERRELIKIGLNGERQSPQQRILLMESITRHLWVAYVALVNVEFILFYKW